MISYNELKKDFDHAVQQLQDICPHKKTQKMPEMWAPGHIGDTVLVCLKCNKVIQRWEPNYIIGKGRKK